MVRQFGQILLTGTATDMDTLIDAASNVVSFSGTMLSTMIANPVYAFMFAAGLVGIGLGVVSKLKRTAKH